MVSQRTTIATNRSSFVPSFAHFFFFFFSFFFFTVFAAEQGIKGLQRLQSEERIRAYARTHTFNTVLKQQEQQQERDERRTRKLLGGGAEYPDIQSPSILTESNFCGIYSELIQCSQYSNANDCNADNRCNFEGSACDIKIGELPGLWLVNAAIAVASVCADAVDAGTCQARVSYGCTWSVNSSSCDLYEVETGLTTLTGDAFLAAIVTVGLFTCESQSLQTNQATCEANNYCSWGGSSCGTKSNIEDLLYPSYCDASTTLQTSQSPGQGQCDISLCPTNLPLSSSCYSDQLPDENGNNCVWSNSTCGCFWNGYGCSVSQTTCLAPPTLTVPSPPPSPPPSSSSRIEEVGLKTLAFAIVFILANVLIV